MICHTCSKSLMIFRHCVFKLPAQVNFIFLNLICVFKCVLWLHDFTRFNFLYYLQCVFSNVSSNCLPVRMYSHIGCICSAFLRCAFSNASSNRLYEMMQIYIGCICLTSLHCVFSNVSSNNLPVWMYSHNGYTTYTMVSLLCFFKCTHKALA